MNSYDDSRINEWFVPKFGPLKFRLFCGLLFLPYTGMCISFVILGNLVSEAIDINRLIGISAIYFVSLGIAAHVADSIGSKRVKPWGNLFTKKQAWIIICLCLVFSYSLGLYYAITYSLLLIIIGIAEGFFLFAYNFELFRGLFHNNFWFSVSWGILPFLAGFVIQGGEIDQVVLLLSLIPFTLSYLEITFSRRYKVEKARNKINKKSKYENRLIIISLGTIFLTIVFSCIRLL